MNQPEKKNWGSIDDILGAAFIATLFAEAQKEKPGNREYYQRARHPKNLKEWWETRDKRLIASFLIPELIMLFILFCFMSRI